MIGADDPLLSSGIVPKSLQLLTEWCGEGASIEFEWKRVGAKPALSVRENHSLTDIVGDSGHISVKVRSSSQLPIHDLGFSYRFEAGKVLIRMDEVAFDIGVPVAVSASPVGSPLIVAWTILSTIQTIYSLLHPQVTVMCGETVRATAVLTQGALSIDFGEDPPSIRVEWRFMLGLFVTEYARSLTGLVMQPNYVVIQFHKSSMYREFHIPVK